MARITELASNFLAGFFGSEKAAHKAIGSMHPVAALLVFFVLFIAGIAGIVFSFF